MPNGTRDVVEDAVIYPILTKEVNGYGGGGRNGKSPGSSGGSLTRTAQGALRDMLGWRYRADDPKGFLAALNKAVNLKEVEGHVEWTWNARPFTVQADLGEVTGAQASIYARAKVALDNALPLLDGLKPLRPDADSENTAATQALVRSAWTELVGELGTLGGPRIQRVDDYFVRLLALKPGDVGIVDADQVGGLLGELRKRFGLDSDRVLTVEEERTYTDFIILVDYTNTIFQTWGKQRKSLFRNATGAKYLGTELVWISEALAVIVESVHEAYDAMDSVFFGPEERQVTLLEFDNGESITVAELLSWIENFAGVEAPQFIESSGKDGVGAVRETLNQINRLLSQVVTE
ncbi:MAG TPA: hypothetical protein VJU77_00650 [Chthoniobacterales bacterium]|nr:hypothetical protein [Chthoniobacterales bacterium]